MGCRVPSQVSVAVESGIALLSRYAAAPLEDSLVGLECEQSTVTSLSVALAADAAQTAARAGW